MMTKEEALAFLNSDELVEEVEKLCEEAKGKGIPGVPFTVIDNRWAVSGGQSSEVFVQVCSREPVPAMLWSDIHHSIDLQKTE